MNKFKSIALTVVVIPALVLLPVSAQNLDSTNYRLISPSLGSPIAGVSQSSAFKQLYDSIVNSYSMTSTNYSLGGGFQPAILANVPQISCFETDTDSGSTTCTGIPGADGMAAVCSSLGCPDRAKIEIDAQSNADDTRYAIQVSTTSDFSSDISYIHPTTRLLSAGPLDDTYFIPKCEWEGTIVAGICAAASTPNQKYTMTGLIPNTTYYARISAHHGTETDGTFTQSAWSPIQSATTAPYQLSMDIDIADDIVTPTAAPHSLSLGTLEVGSVITSMNMIVFKVSTNLASGMAVNGAGLNGGLKHTASASQINSINGDLAAASIGYGLRNDSASNTASNTTYLGDITVSSSPSDFTDAGATHKVGQVPTSQVELFNSGGLQLDQGTSGYFIKAKSDLSIPNGSYSETLSFYVFATI